MKNVLKNPLTCSTVLGSLALILCFQILLGLFHTPRRVLQSDVNDYYAYLPAGVVHRDLTLKFLDTLPSASGNSFHHFRQPNGNSTLKMSMGMSLLYSPFFGAGHVWASVSDRYEADGYSYPYMLMLLLSGTVYVFAGCVFLAGILLADFSDRVTAFVIGLLIWGTNFTYYLIREPAMSHSFSFCLFAMFVYLTRLWHEKPGGFRTLLLALIYGLITLVRPTNAVIALFFIFWNVGGSLSLRHQIFFFWRNKYFILMIPLIAGMVWVPQFFYWKSVSGSWLHYSYQDEGFFFLSPKIISVLFGFRKGWMLYTPLVSCMLLGLVALWCGLRKAFWPVVIFFLVNLYVVSSWWCWWYGGSYSQRAFIEAYVILALPLAAFLQFFLSELRKPFLLLTGLSGLFICHNFFQLLKIQSGSLHMENMTRGAYVTGFRHMKPTLVYQDQLRVPDFESARKGLPESQWRNRK